MSTITLTTMPVSQIVQQWRPGSGDWSWDAEAVEIDSRVCVCCGQRGHYQRMVEDRIGAEGIGFVDGFAPILLGNDGRVWDGHHRLVAARRMGIASVCVEIA